MVSHKLKPQPFVLDPVTIYPACIDYMDMENEIGGKYSNSVESVHLFFNFSIFFFIGATG